MTGRKIVRGPGDRPVSDEGGASGTAVARSSNVVPVRVGEGVWIGPDAGPLADRAAQGGMWPSVMVLFRHKVVVLAGLMATVLAAVALSRLTPPVYTAQGNLLLLPPVRPQPAAGARAGLAAAATGFHPAGQPAAAAPGAAPAGGRGPARARPVGRQPVPAARQAGQRRRGARLGDDRRGRRPAGRGGRRHGHVPAGNG